MNLKFDIKLGTDLASNTSPMYYKSLRYSYDTTDKDLVFKFELAGKSKENVKVFNKDNSINIKIDDKDTYLVDLERFYEAGEYNIDETKASLKNGLLTVSIPKKKTRQKEIEIE